MKSNVNDELLKSSSEESGSEDDEEAWKLTDEVEKEFFKTLSQIKSRDPKIYQKDVEFFKNVPIPEQKPKEKTKTAPLTLREYERKIVIERGGELSDEELPNKSLVQLSYAEEQRALKNSLKVLVQSDSEYESEAEWGGLFKKRQRTKIEEEKEERDYKEWLKGQKSEVPEEVVKEMKPLRDFWTNPDLKQEDQFLRDYLLNKRFLEADDKGDSGVDVDKPLDESEKEETEDELDKKYSHRFEEPDQEFIKRYPRVMENSVRRKDDSRRRKREEIKERKMKEKEKKKSEIKQKQKLKKKEIEQKLEEIKQLTGNDKLAFENVLDNDFDIDEHDKAMQKLFSEEFYSQDDPSFNPTDGTGFEGDWNEDGHEDVQGDAVEYEENNDEPQCEDPNFNMDCDYDPAAENTKLKASRTRRRKDKHRRTTVSEAVKREKPFFDPATHKSYQEYLDQYYAIDCEDFIGDLPCRFKYRNTIPNSYGLSIEEILTADPKELERWCSIKRITQLKPSFKEKGDAKSYQKRAANEELKRKILPSLYKTTDGEKSTITDLEDDMSLHENEIKSESIENNMNTMKKKKEIPSKNILVKNNVSKKRKNDASEIIVPSNKRRKLVADKGKPNKSCQNHKNIKNKQKTGNQKVSNETSSLLHMSDARLQAYGIKPKKFRNKLKYNSVDGNKNKSGNNSVDSKKAQRKKKTVNPSDSTLLASKKGNFEKPQQTTKKSKKKKNIKNKLTNESKSNGWVISNTK